MRLLHAKRSSIEGRWPVQAPDRLIHPCRIVAFNEASGTTTVSFNVTVPTGVPSPGLVVAFNSYTGLPTSLSRNSETIALLSSRTGSTCYVGLYYLANPSTGTYTMTNVGGSQTNYTCVAMVVSNYGTVSGYVAMNEVHPPPGGLLLAQSSVYFGGFLSGKPYPYGFRVLSSNHWVHYLEPVDNRPTLPTYLQSYGVGARASCYVVPKAYT